MTEVSDDMQAADRAQGSNIKAYYYPLRAMGFTRTLRDRHTKFVHEYERFIPKTNAKLTVRIAWNENHTITSQNGDQHGEVIPFGSVDQLRSLVESMTKQFQDGKPAQPAPAKKRK